MRKRARQACEAYTQWVNGDVYGYEVVRVTSCPCCGAEKTEDVESCWGCYGLDYCRGEAESVVLFQAVVA